LIGNDSLVESALQGSRRDLSRLLSLIEKGEEVVIPDRKYEAESMVVGITGPPGVGKSTLVGSNRPSWRRKVNFGWQNNQLLEE